MTLKVTISYGNNPTVPVIIPHVEWWVRCSDQTSVQIKTFGNTSTITKHVVHVEVQS